jgi:aminoglycoside phosphotransferase (APT) family kinase protein
MSTLGRQIAKTPSGDILAWGEDRILKLYRAGSPPTAAEEEAARARVARAAGIPTPAVADVITLEGRVGVVFERTEGPTMLQHLAERPEAADTLARQMAMLQADIHGRTGQGLPSQHERLRTKISRGYALTAYLKAAATAALEALPGGEAFCHGDFHPGNVILTPSGPVVLDWYNATCGNPVADLARTALLFAHAPLPESANMQTMHAVDAVRATFFKAYFRHYTTLRLVTDYDLDAWRLPVAAARLSDPLTSPEHQALFALVTELAAKV